MSDGGDAHARSVECWQWLERHNIAASMTLHGAHYRGDPIARATIECSFDGAVICSIDAAWDCTGLKPREEDAKRIATEVRLLAEAVAACHAWLAARAKDPQPPPRS